MRLYAYQIGQAVKIGLETEVSTEKRRKELRKLANVAAAVSGSPAAPEVVEIFGHECDRELAYKIYWALKIRFQGVTVADDWIKATDGVREFFNTVKDNTAWLEEWAKKARA